MSPRAAFRGGFGEGIFCILLFPYSLLDQLAISISIFFPQCQKQLPTAALSRKMAQHSSEGLCIGDQVCSALDQSCIGSSCISSQYKD